MAKNWLQMKQIFSFLRVELKICENITSLKNCSEKFTKQVSPHREIQVFLSTYFCYIFAKNFAKSFNFRCEASVFKKEFSVPILIRVILICSWVAYCVNSTSLTFHYTFVAQLKPVLRIRIRMF